MFARARDRISLAAAFVLPLAAALACAPGDGTAEQEAAPAGDEASAGAAAPAAPSSATGAVAAPDGPTVVLAEDLEWEEILPGVEFASTTGDWRTEGHAKLVRIAPGVTSPPHTHTGTYHGVVVTGTVVNPFAGEEDPPEMGPGAYWYVPAGAEHSTGCVSEERCLIYTHNPSAWDVQVVEEGSTTSE